MKEPITSMNQAGLLILAIVIASVGLMIPAHAQDSQSGVAYYSLQHAEDWPPLPANLLELPEIPLGNGQFALDDLDVDYQAMQEQAEEEAALLQALGLEEEESGGGSMMSMAMFNSSIDWGWPVYLTNLVAIPSDGSVSATFSIAGGTNFVPYDIWMTTNLANKISESQWTWLGIGYTSNSYTFTGQPFDAAFFALARPQKTMVVAWGNNSDAQCDVPSGLSNAVAVAGGYGQSLALLNDGTVTAWGLDDEGQGSVPTNVVGVAMIASGWYHNVALLTNGTVTAWGYYFPGWNLTNVPPDLTNATVISAQSMHSLALRSDGTVVAWGYSDIHGQTNVPSGLSNVVAIAAGGEHNLVVKADGTVAAWGNNASGQCAVPAGLSNVVDVAAGWAHSVALKSDGTVVAWGNNASGQCNVPAGLSNVVAIAASGDPFPLTDTAYSMALKSDGTVVAWGNSEALNPVSGLSNVVAIGAGLNYGLAVRSGPLTPVIIQEPTDQFQVAGGTATFTVKALGVAGLQYQWQFNAVDISGETNATLTLTNVQAANEGASQVIVSNEAGSIVSSNADFHLVTLPLIISQTFTTNPVFVYQTNATLTVTATGSGQFNGFPLGYQWQLNGTNIAGATSSNYTFEAKLPGTYSAVVSNVVGSTSAVWQVTINYGTFAYHLSTNAVAHANGYTGSSTDMLLLSGWTNSYPAGYSDANMNMGLLTNSVWSTNCWLKGVRGLSATAIGISNGIGGQTLLTMVSPRHFLKAQHTVVMPSRTLVGMVAFLDTNNVIHWRASMEIKELDDGSDTAVGILNEDLPASVGYLSILPTNYTNYLPLNSSSCVQGIGMNQDMKVFGQPMTFESPSVVHWNVTNAAPFGLGTNWNVAIRGGDSSDPERFLINNQLILVTLHQGAFPDGTGLGPNYAFQFDAINQKMNYLSTNNNVGTNYQLTPFSFTNWPVIR